MAHTSGVLWAVVDDRVHPSPPLDLTLPVREGGDGRDDEEGPAHLRGTSQRGVEVRGACENVGGGWRRWEKVG